MRLPNEASRVLGFILSFCMIAAGKKLYSNTWVVQVEGGMEEANRIARNHGFVNLGQVRTLQPVRFLFVLKFSK